MTARLGIKMIFRMLKEQANRSKSDKRLITLSDAQKRRLRNDLELPSHLSLELKDFGEFYECRANRLKKKLREMLK
jgi:hypothetical protein